MRWIERLLDRSTPLKTHAPLSSRWQTCAVGEKHKDFPAVVLHGDVFGKEDSFFPADDRLDDLGTQFHDAVSRGWRRKALKLYDQIEARTRTLIRIAEKRTER